MDGVFEFLSSLSLSSSRLRCYLQDSRNWKEKDAALAEHFYALLCEQVLAVIPISILLIAAMGIFFGRSVDDPTSLVGGMFCAIIGLGLFIDALRVCVMPLSEQLGSELPKNLPLWAVLAISGFLGVLVTYAEPAITTLRPLASLVDPDVAPYLYCALMETQEILIFSIGLGVGCAALLGTLRFVKGWSLKPLILCTLSPTLMCAIYMWWGNPELRPLLGLAWDCGAVTTGPVTVPVLLALGIGVMKCKREEEKKKHPNKPLPKHPNKAKVAEVAQDALEGFGIVTLASLLPVLAVEILSISLTFIYSHEDIIRNKPAPKNLDSLLEKTPFKEIYYSSRAIFPLVGCLIFIVVFILKKPIPAITFYLKEEDIKPVVRDRTSKSGNFVRRSVEFVRAIRTAKNNTQKGGLSIWSTAIEGAIAVGTAEAEGMHYHKGDAYIEESTHSENASKHGDNSSQSKDGDMQANRQSKKEIEMIEAAFSGQLEKHAQGHSDPAPPSASGQEVRLQVESQGFEKVVVPGAAEDMEDGLLSHVPEEEVDTNGLPIVKDKPAARPSSSVYRPPPSNKAYIAMLCGVMEALTGMVLFSIGLTYGFTAIGDQVGTLLPAAFLATPAEEASPYYSYGSGVAVALGTMFCLGFMATRAEPALNVVGQTVEKLSKGSFTCNMLVYSVCFGVGMGMAVGSTKILFGAPLMWFILVKYALALALSVFSSEDFINIAWDSAGVTTGPVTVPFVLSTGVGCSKAVMASEGFGILACASVWPIITVLGVDTVRRLMRRRKEPANPAR